MTSLENNYSWINFNISICFPPMGKHDDFIKISYCIFKIHKPSINLSIKSSYDKMPYRAFRRHGQQEARQHYGNGNDTSRRIAGGGGSNSAIELR